MGIFKKTIQHKKSFHLDEKIKLLNEDLKRTNVPFSDANVLVSENKEEELNPYYDWRKDFYSEEKNIVEEKVEEEIVKVRNKKNESLKKVDTYINSVSSDYSVLKDQIFEEISHDFLLNIPTVEKKIDRVLQIYHDLNEGLLNEPPNVKNSDPLTPLDQKFVTIDELNKHYNLFINRIQEQIATIGGGGETRLKYLDDVVGIATNPSDYDGKFLKYNHTNKTFEFSSVDITNDFWTNGDSNTYTLTNVGIGTTVSESALTVNGDISCSGTITSKTFFGDGSNLRGISPASFVPYSSSSEVSNSALSISGISSYVQVGILTGSYSNDVSDYFGSAVSVSADGKFIAVSAIGDEVPDTITDIGLVYIFERCGNSFNQVGIITGLYANSSGDEFGYSIAFDAIGKTLVVGSRSDEFDGEVNTGVVYVYDRVGVGSTSVYDRVGVITGIYSTNFSDYFGHSVDIDSAGKTIIVGAPYDEVGITETSNGIAYIYDRVGNNFNQVGILTGLYSETSDLFGSSVSVSADGKTFVISSIEDELPGGPNIGLVYVYDRVGNSFNRVGILTGSNTTGSSQFGNSLKISSDAKTIVVGSHFSGSGEVYVYDRVGDSFNQVGILTGLYSENFDIFGTSIAVSADGNSIAVGAINDEISSPEDTGIVYVFKRLGNSFNTVGILTGFYSSDLNDKYGNSLAFSFDGKSLIVGASNDELATSNVNSGLVYVYDEVKETYLYSTSSGNIGIATDNASSKLTVNGDVSVSGIITATDFNSASDISLKENVLQIENPLEKLLQIDGVNFNWKSTGKKSMGVIAQEIEKVIPEVVSGDDIKSVNYNGIIGLLIECVKEQQKEIQELKSRLDK